MSRRLKRLIGKSAFYLQLAVIGIYTVFPFYWAIVSSLKSGSALFQVDFWPTHPQWHNYVAVFREQPFGRNILNSLFVAVSTVALSLALALAAAYAIGRVRFRGRRLLLFVILGVSMFPQIAVLSGMFELISSLGLYNNLLALSFSYLIFTLPFTVWVLTTFMRELPKELEEAAIIDGATPLTIVARVHAADGAGAGDHQPAGVHRGLERIPVCADLYAVERHAHGAGGDRADLRRQFARIAVGQHHGGVGHRHRAADRAGAGVPAAHRLRTHRRRDQGLTPH
jgi:ABC-type sugar transport system permease subunit